MSGPLEIEERRARVGFSEVLESVTYRALAPICLCFSALFAAFGVHNYLVLGWPRGWPPIVYDVVLVVFFLGLFFAARTARLSERFGNAAALAIVVNLFLNNYVIFSVRGVEELIYYTLITQIGGMALILKRELLPIMIGVGVLIWGKMLSDLGQFNSVELWSLFGVATLVGGAIHTSFRKAFQSLFSLREKVKHRGRSLNQLSQARESEREIRVEVTGRAERLERMLRATLELFPDLVLVLDRELNVVFSNWMGLEDVPWKKRHSGAKCYELICAEDHACRDCPVARVFEEGEPRAIRRLVKGRDVEVLASPVRNLKGEVRNVVYHVKDITEQRREESRRGIVEARLRERQRLEGLGRMVGGVAREFNHLLTAVIGYGELLASGESLQGDERVDAISLCHVAEQAAGLSRQLLVFSGGAGLISDEKEISSIIKGMVGLLRAGLKAGVSLDLDLAEGLPKIIVEPSELRLVVMNLFFNAVDAIPEEGIVRVETRLMDVRSLQRLDAAVGSAKQRGEYLCVEVSDTGEGILEEDMGRIFEPFYTTRRPGRGLGLTEVLRVAKSHLGFVEVSSQRGRGTTLRFALPVRVDT